MLKQTAAARNHIHRDKGFKVKHVLQVFVLLGICIWLLNQVRHSYGSKQPYDDGNGSVSEKLLGEHGGIKLGRKNLNPQVQVSKIEDNKRGENEEEEEEEDMEEIKSEEGDDEGRGGGDDEIDGQDQEKTEEESEVEDLIDEEDREKENQIEDSSLIEGQIENEGDDNSQEAREENYKGDDASSAVLQKSITLGKGAQIQRMRKLDG